MTTISSQKNCFAAIWKEKKWYTNCLSNKKEDDCCLEPEKLFRSYLEGEKSNSQIVGARKKTMTAISCQKNWFATNWKEKKVVLKSLGQEKRG